MSFSDACEGQPSTCSASTVRPLAPTSAKPPRTSMFSGASAFGLCRPGPRRRGSSPSPEHGPRDAEVALGAGDGDHVDVFRTDQPGRGDESKTQGHFLQPFSRPRKGRDTDFARIAPSRVEGRSARPPFPNPLPRGCEVNAQASSAIFLAFSTASSMPPTM